MSEGSLRKRGDKWYYSFEAGSIDGTRKRIEHPGGRTKAEASAALRAAMQEYENGGVKIRRNNYTIHDYFDYWFDSYVMKELRPNTQSNYRNVIDKYIDPAIGRYKLKSISPAKLQKMMDDLGKTGLSKHSVEIILTVLRKGLKMAVFPYQLIKENPGNYIGMPRFPESHGKTRSDLRIITLEQYRQILAITPFSNPFNVPLQLAFGTGMRRGEVSGLEWSAVDLENGTIDIHQAMLQKTKKKRKADAEYKTKVKYSDPTIKPGHERSSNAPWDLGPLKTSASYRKISIGPSVIELLKKKRADQEVQRERYGKYYYDSDFVCTKENGKPVTPNSIKYHADKIQKELGFPFDFHSLRHTHATMLLQNGDNIKSIQKRLGHARISTTLDTYAHVTDEMNKKSVDIFEGVMADVKQKSSDEKQS